MAKPNIVMLESLGETGNCFTGLMILFVGKVQAFIASSFQALKVALEKVERSRRGEDW